MHRNLKKKKIIDPTISYNTSSSDCNKDTYKSNNLENNDNIQYVSIDKKAYIQQIHILILPYSL